MLYKCAKITMKKIVFVFAILLLFCNLSAQKKFSFLKEIKIFDVEIDYSKAWLKSKKAHTFFALENLENAEFEENYKNEMLIKFVKYSNFPLPSKYSIGLDTLNAEYKIVVTIIAVGSNGNTDAVISIVKIDSKEIISMFSAYGRGGTFGSFTNLSGDGMTRLGTQVGNLFARKIGRTETAPKTGYY